MREMMIQGQKSRVHYRIMIQTRGQVRTLFFCKSKNRGSLVRYTVKNERNQARQTVKATREQKKHEKTTRTQQSKSAQNEAGTTTVNRIK